MGCQLEWVGHAFCILHPMSLTCRPSPHTSRLHAHLVLWRKESVYIVTTLSLHEQPFFKQTTCSLLSHHTRRFSTQACFKMSSPSPATEIAVLTLKADTPIEDVSTPAGQIFHQMLNTIKSQSGFQQQYWGRQLENPNHLVLSIGKKGQSLNPLPAFLRPTSLILTFSPFSPSQTGTT